MHTERHENKFAESPRAAVAASIGHAATPNDLFLERISNAARRFGTRPAISAGGRETSYRELFAIAHGIRETLEGHGFGQARRIGIVSGDTVDTYASLLAVWSLGAAYVPLNARHPAGRNARIVEQAGLDVVLSSRDPLTGAEPDGARAGTARIVCTAGVEPNPEPLHFAETSPADLAYIFFTSGSTGAPKGVPISHANLSTFMGTVLSRMQNDFSPEDRFLQMFELTFDLSVFSILAPWSVGACCCVVAAKGIGYMNVLTTLAREKITVALMVPSLLPYLQRFFAELRFPELRLNQFCGEALMQDMLSAWAPCVPNAELENMYGPTEATIYCTKYSWDRTRSGDEAVNGIVPIGTAMPGTRTLIVDEHGGLCRPGIKGELCLAGEQLMSGYWNDKRRTAEAFLTVTVDGQTVTAYRTGDIAFVNANGDLVFCGRTDSQVKIDGHRVELGEIEYFARQFIGSSAAAAITVKEPSGASRIKLFVGGDPLDRQGLDRCLKDNLPAYMRPSSITILPELPLNLNGKIDRPALSKQASDQNQKPG